MEITVAKIKEVIGLYGIEVLAVDDNLIQFVIDKVTQHIKNETNQPEVPRGAYEIAFDMVCYEFLMLKYSMGTLDIGSIDINASAISKIKDGDTDVTYNTNSNDTPLGRFQGWLNSLSHPDYDWGIWRRLRW